MNRIQILIITASVLLLQISALYGSPVFMGGIETVGTEFAFDAIRNPALLPLQKNRQSIGVSLYYSPYAIQEEHNRFQASGATVTEDDANTSLNQSGSLYLAYCKRVRDLYLGIGLKNGEEDQFKLLESDSNFAYNTSYTKTEESETIINPSLVLSAGFAITSKDYLGVRVQVEYFKNKQKEDEEKYDGANTKNINDIYDITAFTLQFSAGYFGHMGPIELGLILNSGKLSIEWMDYEYDYFLNGVGISSNSASSNTQFIYTKSPSIESGILVHFGQDIQFALELELCFPVKFKRNTYYFSDGSSTMESLKIDYVNYMAGSIKMGFSFRVSDYSVFSIGGGVVINSEKMAILDFNLITNDLCYYVVTGWDYSISRNTMLFLGLQYSYSQERQENDNPGSLDVDDIRYHTFTAIAGVSFGL